MKPETGIKNPVQTGGVQLDPGALHLPRATISGPHCWGLFRLGGGEAPQDHLGIVDCGGPYCQVEPLLGSERLQPLAESADEAPDVLALAMLVEAGKAGPAEAQAQIVDERQLVPLVGQQGIGAEERQFDRVWRAAADVGLMQIVGRKIEAERVDEIGIGLLALFLPLLEQVADDARWVDAQGVRLVHGKVDTQLRKPLVAFVVPYPVDPARDSPEGAERGRQRTTSDRLDAVELLGVVGRRQRPQFAHQRPPSQGSQPFGDDFGVPGNAPHRLLRHLQDFGTQIAVDIAERPDLTPYGFERTGLVAIEKVAYARRSPFNPSLRLS